MIDTEELTHDIEVWGNIKTPDFSTVHINAGILRSFVKASKAYLASQSKPADGVEGDLQKKYEHETDKAYNLAIALGEVHKENEELRHALQSTAKLRAQVERTKEALGQISRMRPYIDNVVNMATLNAAREIAQQSLANLGE